MLFFIYSLFHRHSIPGVVNVERVWCTIIGIPNIYFIPFVTLIIQNVSEFNFFSVHRKTPTRNSKREIVEMAVFTTCCCFSLRTGCIIIGALDFVLTLMGISSQSMVAIIIGMVAAALLVYGAGKRKRFFLLPWIVLHVILIIILIVVVFLCIFASAILFDIIQVEGGKQDAEMDKQIATTILVFAVVILLIFIVILIFLTLVVGSYYCELRKESERQHNDSKAQQQPHTSQSVYVI